jgi:Conjugative transposon protein TraO
MKKQIILMFIFIATAINTTNAQFSKSISVLGGVSGINDSYVANMNFTLQKSKSNYEIGLLYSTFKNTKYVEVEYSIVTLQLGYLHNIIFSRSNSFILSIGGGGAALIEKIKQPENYVIIKQEKGVGYGMYGVIQVDYYLSDKLSLIIRGQETYSIKSSTGNLNPYFGLGIKFNL